MTWLDKKKLLNLAESLGEKAGKSSKALWTAANDVAKTTDMTISTFGRSYNKAARSTLVPNPPLLDSSQPKVSGLGIIEQSKVANLEPVTIEGNLENHSEEIRSFYTPLDVSEKSTSVSAAAFCEGKNCTSDALQGGRFCALHQREYDQFKARHCGTKMRHETLEDARLHAADLSAKSGGNYSAYSCRICNSFHTGTSKLG